MFVLAQQLFDLFDGFSRGLDLVVAVHSVNGALGTYGTSAGETVIGQFFVGMVLAGVSRLVATLSLAAGIAGLGHGRGCGMVATSHAIFSLSASGVDLISGSAGQFIGVGFLIPAGCFTFSFVFGEDAVQFLEFEDGGAVELGLLSALSAGVDLIGGRGTGELWG